MYTANRILVNPAQVDKMKDVFQKLGAAKCAEQVTASEGVKVGGIILCDEQKRCSLHFRLE